MPRLYHCPEDLVRPEMSRLGWLGLGLVALLMGAAIVLLEPAIAIMLAMLIALGTYILFDFRVGVVIACLLMPLYQTSFFPHQLFGITGANPMNFLLLATLGSYAVRRRQHHVPRYRLMPRRLLWLFLAPMVLASLFGAFHVDQIPFASIARLNLISFNDVPGYFRDNLLRPLVIVLFALLLAAAVRESKNADLFVVPFLISLWLLSALVTVTAIVKTGGDPSAIATTARGMLSEVIGLHPNELGLLFNIAFAALLFSVGTVRGRLLRIFYVASTGLMAVSVLMTFSRGAFLGMATVALLFLLSRRKFSTIIVAALLLAAAMLALPGAVRDRAAMGIEGGNIDVISAGRTDGIWLPLLGYAMESPIIGHGLAATLWSEPMRKDPTFHVGHAHSAYINTFLDMGLIGLVLLPGFFVLQVREFRRLGTDTAVSPLLRGIFQGAAAGVVVYFIQGLTDDRFTPTASQITLWFLIGLSFGKSSALLRPLQQHGVRPRTA